MANELFQARLPDDFAADVHDFAEERHMSKSEAVRHLLRAGLDAEAEAEPEAVPDGGFITREEHPWVEPLIQTAYHFSRLSIYVFFVALLGIAIPSGATQWFGASLSPSTAALFLSFFSIMVLIATAAVAVALAALLVLEVLMDPREAPFRRWFTPDTPGTPEATA